MIDGNWVEMLALGCGFLGICVKPAIRKYREISPCWVFRDAGNDFLNAASLAPFALLMAGVFNTWIFDQLVKSGKLPLGLAGGIGVLYVLKELLSLHSSSDQNGKP
jgi:hypothetical protein